MMSWTHMVVSAIATSLILETADPVTLTVGAIAGLLPDVDISTSIAGRVLPWLSNWLERRFPHRSCTHSFVASTVVGVFAYGSTLLTERNFLQVAHALTIGYFFGWLLDMFTKTGVEMFWPATERYVCPGNRKFRIKTGSSVEYTLLILLIAIALLVFNINASGGLMRQFNRLIALPSGVEELYNQSGATHLILTHIKGIRNIDRGKILGDFTIIESLGESFIVQSQEGKIYKVGLDSNSQIISEQITADIGPTATTHVETLTFDDEELTSKLEQFNREGAKVFLSGQVSIDDADEVQYIADPYEFPFIKISGSSLNLENAPLMTVMNYFSNQYATGQLEIKIINIQNTSNA